MKRAAAVAIWVLPFAAVAFLVGTGLLLQTPLCRAYVCTDKVGRPYPGGAQPGPGREPLYQLGTIDLFQYFPQAALLFAPFAALGTAGGVLWRGAGWALLA